MGRARFKSEAGQWLLEFSVVVPVLFGTVLAAIDINNILHGYSALRAGVETSLRCSFTADGLCLGTNSTTTPERLYRISRTEITPQWEVALYNYNAQARWFSYPHFEYPSATARVLVNVQAEIPSSQYYAEKRWHAGAKYVSYNLLEARLPYAHGNDDRNPRFSFRYDRNGQSLEPSGSGPAIPFPAAHSVSLSGVRLEVRGSGQRDVARVPFTIPRPSDLGSFACVQSQALDREPGPHTGNLTSDCPEDPLANTAELALHIKGSGRTPSGTQTANVKIDVVRRDGNGWAAVRDLGGQQFTQSGGNFRPRGLPQGYVKDDWQNLPEYDKYNSLHLRYDTQYYLQFELEAQDSLSPGERMFWNGSEMDIFLSRFNQISAEAHPCDLPKEFTKTELGIVDCKTDIPTGTRASVGPVSSAGVTRSERVNISDSCQFTPPSAEQTELRIHAAGYSDPQNFEAVYPDAQGCTSEHRIFACPENKGVKGGAANNSQQAKSVCPVPAPYTNYAVNLTWQETELRLPGMSWDKTDCDVQDAPPSYQGFEDISFENPVVSRQDLFLPELDPAQLKINDPRYQCAELELHSENFDENASLPNTSIFVGNHPDLGVNNSTQCQSWRETLRAEAIANGMFGGAYFEPSANKSGTLITSSLPSNNCIQYTAAPDLATALQSIISTSCEMPSECYSPNLRCSCDFDGLDGNGQGNLEPDLASATKFGLNELQAAYGRARGCAADDLSAECASLNVRRLDDSIISASGKIQIPIKLFFGKTVELSYNSRRRFEQAFFSR